MSNSIKDHVCLRENWEAGFKRPNFKVQKTYQRVPNGNHSPKPHNEVSTARVKLIYSMILRMDSPDFANGVRSRKKPREKNS